LRYTAFICSALAHLRAIIVIVLISTATSAHAVDPAHAITQYAHRVWRIGYAGLDSPPFSIAQDHNGYIWLGTANGLYKFNGVNFELWRDRSTSLPNLEAVRKLFVAHDGSIYVGALGGLFHIVNNRLTHLNGSMEYPGPFVQDDRARIWLPHAGIRYVSSSACFIDGDDIRCLGKSDGLSCPASQSAAIDRRGTLWLGGPNGICRRDPTGRSQEVSPPALKQQHEISVSDFAVTPDGGLFAGLSAGGAGLGLMRLTHGRWITVSEPQANGASLAISSMWADRQGAVWIGTFGQGLYRYANHRLDHFTAEDGLSDNEILGGMEDREGSVWVVTPRGVDQFHDLAIVPYSAHEGLLGGGSYTAGPAKDGSVWISTSQNVYAIRKEAVQKLYRRDPRYTNGYAALFGDSSGAMWVGSLEGGLRWVDGRPPRHPRPPPALDRRRQRRFARRRLGGESGAAGFQGHNPSLPRRRVDTLPQRRCGIGNPVTGRSRSPRHQRIR
jgi:ligand-binding sensor domain-containing protein